MTVRDYRFLMRSAGQQPIENLSGLLLPNSWIYERSQDVAERTNRMGHTPLLSEGKRPFTGYTSHQ